MPTSRTSSRRSATYATRHRHTYRSTKCPFTSHHLAYTRCLSSLSQCVQETCNFDTIFSYLTCGNYDFRYDMQKGLRPRRSVRMAMSHEIMFYAIAKQRHFLNASSQTLPFNFLTRSPQYLFRIVQKEGLGLDKAVEEAKSRMARYNVTPNMLIVPPQLLLYMAVAPEEKIRYALRPSPA